MKHSTTIFITQFLLYIDIHDTVYRKKQNEPIDVDDNS